MATTTSLETRRVPTRRLFDPSSDRLTVVLDVHPASPADLSVRVGPDRLHVTLEPGPEGAIERTFTPPVGRGSAFDVDGADAVVHNGVLEVTVDVVDRPIDADASR